MSGVGDGREVELCPRVAGESATIKMSTTVGKIKRVRTVAPSASDFAALVEMYGNTPATDEPSIRETSPGKSDFCNWPSRSPRPRRLTINPLLIVQEAEHERSSRILHERKKNTQDETSMKLVLDRLIRKPPNQAIVVIRQPN